MPECQEQYETLRRQALEPIAEAAPYHKSMAAAFIECQGLAAWVEHGPESVVPADGQTAERQKAESSHSELVIVLAALVIDKRKE
jgi:hypothetical protein